MIFSRRFFLVWLGAFVAVFPFAVVRAASGGPPLNRCDIEFAKLGRHAKLTEKTELVSTYLRRVFTTVSENEAWIKMAKYADSKSRVLFGDIEFSMLGPVNNLTDDKNFATSLANKNKELTFERLEAFKKMVKEKYPQQVDDVLFYSDFKSVRFAIVPKTKPLSLIRSRQDRFEELPPNLKGDLAKMFAGANAEFAEFVEKNGFNVDGKVENWFRGGVGATADEANFAARTSRDMGGVNKLQDFENTEIQESLDIYKNWGESMRLGDLLPDPAMKPLLDGSFVKDEVLDIVKKTSNAAEARARLKAKYGADLNETQVERIQTYNDIIDKFSPGIHIAERKIASLADAEIGGLSADFSGLSAKNRGATARALAEAKGLRDAIKRARRGEEQVTAKFKASMTAFEKIMGRYLARSVSSGDDFVGIPKQAWTAEHKKNLMNDLAKLEIPSAQRIAFIPNGVIPEERNLLAAHGEAIEKVLRQQLEGKVAHEKLRHVIFGIDMNGKAAGSGRVSLITGVGENAGLSSRDRAEIKTAFDRAVRLFNQKVDKEKAPKAYVTK